MSKLPQVDPQAYSEYLRQRSRIGFLYRKFWLYPRLGRRLRGRVLDFGCGIGDFLRFRNNTVGADINAHNVAYCVQNGLEAIVVESNCIPINDGNFDGVMLDNVLEHIPAESVDAVLAEIKRVLKPGGTILVGVPGQKGYRSDPDHKVFYNEDSLVALFARQGFDAKEILLMPLPCKRLESLLRQFCIYAVFTAKNTG